LTPASALLLCVRNIVDALYKSMILTCLYLLIMFCDYCEVDMTFLMKLWISCTWMAVASQNSASEAVPLNGFLYNEVDCDELIATVYGMHLHIRIISIVCFLHYD